MEQAKDTSTTVNSTIIPANQQQLLPKQGILEEDDEFEEFPVEGLPTFVCPE